MGLVLKKDPKNVLFSEIPCGSFFVTATGSLIYLYQKLTDSGDYYEMYFNPFTIRSHTGGKQIFGSHYLHRVQVNAAEVHISYM